ncbi:MAG TPA: phosphate acyltransferase PlsX [Nitrospiria bacterium]|jgi:glycerol-3-phosphate acyltransferase PlsX
MRIAIDAMGGDNAPEAIMEGAISAILEYDVELICVGNEAVLSPLLKKMGGERPNLRIVHAPEKVEMDESPSHAIRKKKNSSIWVATHLIKEGKAEAVISAGNTGAAMATALFILGPLKGVDRPAIATVLPTLQGSALLLDVGANVDCKPNNLLQFAIMGEEFARRVQGKVNPRVGLLSIGEEAIKGNELTKETFRLLRERDLNFIGNVEGRDVYNGNADVIVCDGFIGNVVLKVSEGLADTIGNFLKREIEGSSLGVLGYLLLKPALNRFKKKVDYAEYGGAHLLGVNGVSIICHGRSSGKAIKNAIKMAKQALEQRVNEAIQRDIERQMNPEEKEREKK